MSPEFKQTLDQLSQQYQVLGVIDLKLALSRGEKYLSDQLTELRKSEFNGDDRIVTFIEGSDEYEFTAHPGQTISILQRYLTLLDIPNFFVVTVGDNPDLLSELEAVRQHYSTESNPIAGFVVNNPGFVKQDSSRDSMCILPWMHLYVGPDGNVLPCCLADHSMPLGNVRDHSVHMIVNQEPARQLRKNMLERRPSRECAYCYRREDAGLSSPRLENNVHWARYFNRVFESVNSNKPIKLDPVYLDIRLNNICNLKCRMCSGYFSSSIAQEDQVLFHNSNFKNSTLHRDIKAEALHEITEYLPHVEKIYFAGGEPLLMDEHYKILDALIACGNTDLDITYNTNFTKLSFKGRSVLDYWNQFSNVNVGASIDAEGVVAEYVRSGTVWTDIEQNVNKLTTTCPHVKFKVTSTVSMFTVLSLIKLQQDWTERKVVELSQFEINPLQTPDYLSLQALPADIKTHIVHEITEHCQWLADHCAADLVCEWQQIVKFTLAADHSHLLPELRRLTEIVDHHRNERMLDVLPELKGIF